MVLRGLVAALLAACPVALSALPAAAERPGPPDDWERLGCVSVGRDVEREVIQVGRKEGRFKAIRLTARGNDVRIEDLKVIYGNGNPDEIQVREVLEEGGRTRAIDLKGNDRFIDRIVMRLQKDYKGRGRGPAEICVVGLSSAGPRRPPPPHWDDLGCVEVGIRKEFDVIEVGRREGRYQAIRLFAKGGDVEINDLKVVYGNGLPDDIQVRKHLRQGDQTLPLDLKGRDRLIRQLELRTKRDPKDVLKNVVKGLVKGDARINKAIVCAEGLQVEGGRGPGGHGPGGYGPGPGGPGGRPGDHGGDRGGPGGRDRH